MTWRIADPERFLAALATPAAAEQRLSDVVLAEIGAVMGQYPASVLISTDQAKHNYQAVSSEVARRAANFARTAYGIDVVSVDVRRLYPPELNREHVFERMMAERAKIAKENRSAGEVEAKRIIAEADHEKSRIDSDAAGQAERIKAEADAEASRTYAAAFTQDPRFYQFLRTLRAYDKLLDEKTTIFLPADTGALQMLHFDKQPGQVGTIASPAHRTFNRRRSSAERKTPGGGPMTLASDHALAGDTRREADHAAEDLTRGVQVRPRHQLSRLAWHRRRYWILTILGLFLGAHLISGFYVVGADERAVVRRFGAVAAELGPGIHYRFPWPVDRMDVVKTTSVKKSGSDLRYPPVNWPRRPAWSW